MNFWKKLFGRESSATLSSHSSDQKLTEADNLGTRCDTQGKGEAYFVTLFLKDPEPILFYFFDSKEKAEKALAEISCIAIANDTGKLISTIILTYGVFPAVDTDGSTTWGVLLAGKNLTYDLCVEARESFKKHGGRMRREDNPSKSTPTQQNKSDNTSSVISPRDKINNKVTFSHDINLSKDGGIGTKKIYKAPNKKVALEYLKPMAISQSYYYVEIETPEGWVGKDKEGIYEF